MPFVLRKIRKAKWYKNENVPWLAEGEVQADALVDLSTQSNALSIWMIEDDFSNFQRIAAALSANSDTLSNFDYSLLDAQFMIDVGYKFAQIAGDTPDEGANDWHRDLTELTIKSLVEFARLIQTQATIDRVSDKNILRFVVNSVREGFIDRSLLKPSLLNKVEKLL